MSITINPHHGGWYEPTNINTNQQHNKKRTIFNKQSRLPVPSQTTAPHNRCDKKYLVCYAIEFSNNTRTHNQHTDQPGQHISCMAGPESYDDPTRFANPIPRPSRPQEATKPYVVRQRRCPPALCAVSVALTRINLHTPHTRHKTPGHNVTVAR